MKQYRCEALTVEGFIQQVAVSYLTRGYWFYVAGHVPERKDPQEVDAKLVTKYGITVSKKERSRRKLAGLANMQYIRHGRFFLLLATHGQHPFFEEEFGQFRDARHVAIKYAGYSISYRNGRACVRIERDEYKRLKAWLVDLACRRTAEKLAGEFLRLPYVAYAPVRQQVLQVWRAVNRARKEAGYERLPVECVRWKRPIVKPFGEAELKRVA